ncbi:MAG: LysR substrate-binding domain-containing protein [Burkholderiales bacterium]|nr:LysR substrate-binding domain-containing protein [Burkholderiales bacterium]
MARELPALDLLPGFEAAARHLSITRAAGELHLTQSALSRQIQALEEQVGVALFERHHRRIALTEHGRALYRVAAEVLRRVREAVADARGGAAGEAVAVTTTLSFASLWLVPRLASFRAAHPAVDVRISANNALIDLARERVDVAIRLTTRARAGKGAVRLFGDRVFPVCSPRVLATPLARPADLARHVLLHYEDPDGSAPWLSWRAWLELAGAEAVKGTGALRFSHYDQLIQAAIDGQGVALGRSPLVDKHLREGRLVAPLGRRFATKDDAERAYFVVVGPHAEARPAVGAFVAWLRHEARASVRGKAAGAAA